MKNVILNQNTSTEVMEILNKLEQLPAEQSAASYLKESYISFLNKLIRFKVAFQNDDLKYGTQVVKRITIVEVKNQCVLELTTSTQKIFLIDNDPLKKNIAELYRLLNHHSLIEHAFLSQEKRAERYQWESFDTETRYNADKIKNFYATSYIAIAKAILTHYQRMGNSSDILIISAGCGPGNDVKTIVQYLRAECKNISIFSGGFTLRENDRLEAENNNPEGIFLRGELYDVASHVSKIREHFTQKQINNNSNNENKNITVFLFYSGTATRDITNGTYETVTNFQKGITAGVDAYIVDGYEHITITNRLAKGIGYQLIDSQYRNEGTKTLLVFEKQSRSKRLEYLLNKANKLSVIDLSFSANPVDDLELLKVGDPKILSKAEILDISWSKIDSSDYAKLLKLIVVDMPLLKTIYIAKIEPWALDLSSRLMRRGYTVKQRLDSHVEYYPYEVAPLSIVAAERWGFFSCAPKDLLLPLEPSNINNNQNGLTTLFMIIPCKNDIDLTQDKEVIEDFEDFIKDRAKVKHGYFKASDAIKDYNTTRLFSAPNGYRPILVEFATDMNLDEKDKKIEDGVAVAVQLYDSYLPYMYICSLSSFEIGKLMPKFRSNENIEEIFKKNTLEYIEIVKDKLKLFNNVKSLLENYCKDNSDDRLRMVSENTQSFLDILNNKKIVTFDYFLNLLNTLVYNYIGLAKIIELNDPKLHQYSIEMATLLDTKLQQVDENCINTKLTNVNSELSNSNA